jgi:RNA polymerase sigma factor for flagellar operon FliA
MPSDSIAPFAAEFDVLEDVVTVITRRRRMRREDAEDFRQSVYLRLVERNFDAFRRFDGRSSLRTYLLVVVNRMLLNARNREFGKWRPSVAARRHGSIAIQLERLIHRDGYSFQEAVQHLYASGVTLSEHLLQQMAADFPSRGRRLFVTTLAVEASSYSEPSEAWARQQEIARRRAVLARALAGLDYEERRLIWLRFRRELTMPTIAMRMHRDPKALYRRLQRLLLTLQRCLRAEGICGVLNLDI